MDKQQASKVLGIEVGASERDVRRAYRALLFDLEDNGQSDPAYPEKKQNLEEAFEICLKEAGKAKGSAQSLPGPTEVEPVNVKRKLLLRVGILVAATLLVIWAYTQFRQAAVDIRGESEVKTAGMIAALETVGNSTRIVAFNSDGTKIESPVNAVGIDEKTIIDRDIAWRNDGNRILYVSNRDHGNFNVFRWNPLEKTSDLRSTTGRPKSNLWFGWTTRAQMRDFGLLTSGGFVFQYDQKKATTVQLLPPPVKRTQGVSGDDQGTVGQLDEVYKKIGESFLAAKWGLGRKLLYTVMRRETGEVFVNPLDENYNKGMPAPLFAGKKIEFDVTPRGDAIVVIRGFEFVDPAQVPRNMMKDGKPILPFDNVIFLVPGDGSLPVPMCHSRGTLMYFGAPDPKAKPIAKLDKGSFTFANPAVSPDGTMVAFIVGASVGESGYLGQSVILFPLLSASPIKEPVPVVQGPVSDVSWAPESNKLVLLQTSLDGKRSIYVAEFATRTVKRITLDGDYSSPHFSPQKSPPPGGQ